MKRAKIVCTIGPASASKEIISRLIDAGMDVARMNFSHGTREDHRKVYELIRELSDRVAIIQDLQGPKIRVGEMPEGGVRLREGDRFILSTQEREGNEGGAHVTYPELNSDVKIGDNIYLADGIIHLQVEDVSGNDVVCRVIHGGILQSHQGVNLPGVDISTPSLTEKDRGDLEFGLDLGVDYVALSFVRSVEDVLELKRIIASHDSSAQVIAKVEKREALEALPDIVSASDAVMIARGDLGVELPTEDVPVYQKLIIRECISRGKTVITATQMLESMVHSERPTRAEATDVANAVIDGTDALMLSAETATGEFPVESVATMRRIIEKTEELIGYREGEVDEVDLQDSLTGGTGRGMVGGRDDIGRKVPFGIGTTIRQMADIPPIKGEDERQRFLDAVCSAAVKVSEEVGASAIAVLTHSGKTARIIARYRPTAPLIALTDYLPVIRRMSLVWGVQTIPVESIEETEKIFPIVARKIGEAGFRGKIVITAGIPTRERSVTNTIHVVEI